MTIKYDKFLAALSALCKEHKVLLFTSDDDIEVRDAYACDGDEEFAWQDQLKDKTSPDHD